jgi:hypothetical protein
LPASGCEMIAKVRRRWASCAMVIVGIAAVRAAKVSGEAGRPASDYIKSGVCRKAAPDRAAAVAKKQKRAPGERPLAGRRRSGRFA